MRVREGKGVGGSLFPIGRGRRNAENYRSHSVFCPHFAFLLAAEPILGVYFLLASQTAAPAANVEAW